MKYAEQAKHIWQTYVPATGQADTVQGELLRAIEKLRDEAQRNGNLNWDEHFVLLCHFVQTTLQGSQELDDTTKAAVQSDISRLLNSEHPYTEDDLYDRLTEAAMEWCLAHPEPVPHPQNPALKR